MAKKKSGQDLKAQAAKMIPAPTLDYAPSKTRWEDEPEDRNPFDIAGQMREYILREWSKR